MEKKYFIYITTNMVNGKRYIGQHYGKTNDTYLGSGLDLIKAVEKYGKENFKREILEICKKEELDEKEKYWIKKYDAYNSRDFYNLTEGGQKGDGWRAAHRWAQNNPEEAKKIYKKMIEGNKKWQEEHPEEVQESIKKMIEGSKKWRKEHPEELKEIVKNLNNGKEQWQKEHPEEHQKQVDAWRKSGSDANSQQIKCLTTGEIFSSQSEAARHYNIQQANISKCLKGERKSAGKHPETGEKLFWEIMK